MRVAVIGGDARTLVNFRGPMIRAMRAAGHDVVGIALDHEDQVAEALGQMGASFKSVAGLRAGRNPFSDLVLLKRLISLLRTDPKPDVTLCYTAKPVVYGLLASALAGVSQRYAMITGSGAVLTTGLRGRNITSYVVLKNLYRATLKYARSVFFQNEHDEELFRSMGLISASQRTCRINGSGVDLDRFAPTALPAGPITFLLIARLIKTKGVPEFVEAAQRIRSIRSDIRFQLLGPLDPNPRGVSRSLLDRWVANGAIEYLGFSEDVRPFIAGAHAVVLPSYYGEGVPRSLLEGLAMARAIITTDAPGCRETVRDGENGLCVPQRDVDALAAAMLRLADTPQDLPRMAAASRKLAENRFDVNLVNRTILDEMGLAPAAVRSTNSLSRAG